MVRLQNLAKPESSENKIEPSVAALTQDLDFNCWGHDSKQTHVVLISNNGAILILNCAVLILNCAVLISNSAVLILKDAVLILNGVVSISNSLDFK